MRYLAILIVATIVSSPALACGPEDLAGAYRVFGNTGSAVVGCRLSVDLYGKARGVCRLDDAGSFAKVRAKGKLRTSGDCNVKGSIKLGKVRYRVSAHLNDGTLNGVWKALNSGVGTFHGTD